MALRLCGDGFLVGDPGRTGLDLDPVAVLEQPELDPKVLLTETTQHHLARGLHTLDLQRRVLGDKLLNRLGELGLGTLA